MNSFFEGCGCIFFIAIVLFIIIGKCVGVETTQTTESEYQQPTPQYTSPVNTYPTYYTHPQPQRVYEPKPETPDDAYDNGYDEGYNQGLEDGKNGRSHGYGYDDYNDYYNYYKTKYEEGYEDGYYYGYSSGKQQYEEEHQEEDSY